MLSLQGNLIEYNWIQIPFYLIVYSITLEKILKNLECDEPLQSVSF